MPPPGGGGLSAPADRECRAHGGGKRGKGHRMVPFPPLDSPKPSFEPLSEAFAAKRGDGGSVPCVGQVLGRFQTLNLLCAVCRAYQCAARRCRAAAFRCEKLRFDQGCALGAPNAPVGPSLLDAQPKGVASEGKCGGCQEGDKKPGGCLGPLLPLPPGGGNARLAHRQPFFACGGKPPERREIYI